MGSLSILSWIILIAGATLVYSSSPLSPARAGGVSCSLIRSGGYMARRHQRSRPLTVASRPPTPDAS